MRTILLSFSPECYKDLSSGRKIYEHRKRFFDEPVIAYIYLGLPYRQIVAKIHLGKREELSDWLTKYSYDVEAVERINDYLTRNRFAMPIYSFQEIEPIDARLMEYVIDGFRVPISYMFLDDKPELFNYIKSREVIKGKEITHCFDNITSKEICIC